MDKNILCDKSNFLCTKMLLKTTKKKNLRDQKIIFLKGISKKQIRKMIKELFFLFRCQNKFRNFFREGFKQVLCQKKKRGRVYLV